VEPAPTIELRTATRSDAGEILTLQRAAWVPEAQRHGWFFIPPLTQTLQEIREDIDTQTVLVTVLGHRIVGTVRGVRRRTDWYIGRLGVVPDLQGQGLGRRLLAAIEASAPDGVARFTLTTGPKSVENIAFYERHGYRRVPGADELVHLEKLLD
jgi:tRNA (guanine37-N1)-methyltransferase